MCSSIGRGRNTRVVQQGAHRGSTRNGGKELLGACVELTSICEWVAAIAVTWYTFGTAPLGRVQVKVPREFANHAGPTVHQYLTRGPPPEEYSDRLLTAGRFWHFPTS